MSEISDKDFKAGILKRLQQALQTCLKQMKKREISEKKQKVSAKKQKKKEPNGNLRIKLYNNCH